MRAFIVCLVAVASVVSGAPTSPTDIESRSLVVPLSPEAQIAPGFLASAGSAAHHESSFDKGAHQSAASSGQGSVNYNHGTQASKNFGDKVSTGSRENYAYSANNAYNQGAGSFSHSGGLNHAAHLTSGLGKHFQQTGGVPGFGHVVPGVVPGLPGVGIPVIPTGGFSSQTGNHQQGSAASGHAQGQGSYSYNQGHSSINSSGNKETFTNKESFGNESSASHAVGAAQNAHSQSAQAGHHEKGHEVTSANHGSTVIG